ncbi:unnamed protein product [marine sediment metagenome]|uniref:Uncharacterized protein n=1 Tax=marine sediment metagenome TaxID=412755 RepID=X1GMA4_9ZZZZ
MNQFYVTPFSKKDDVIMKDSVKENTAIYYCSECKKEKEIDSETEIKCECGNDVFRKKRTKKSRYFIFY